MQALNSAAGREVYREPVDVVLKVGFHIDDVEHVWSDIVVFVLARRTY